MALVVILWIVFSILIGMMANNYGRNVVGFVLIAVLLSPLIAFIILLVVGKTENKKEEEMEEQIMMRNKIEERVKQAEIEKSMISGTDFHIKDTVKDKITGEKLTILCKQDENVRCMDNEGYIVIKKPEDLIKL